MSQEQVNKPTVLSQTIMEDFVFGGIEADDNRLLQDIRRNTSGLRHRYRIDPLDPRPGAAVNMTVYAGPEIIIDRMTAYVTVDGTLPAGTRGNARNGMAIPLTFVNAQWEPILWDYVGIWHGTLPAQMDGAFVQYTIEGWRSYDESTTYWCSEPNLDGTVEQPTRYGYTVDSVTNPTWAQQAVLYQIFVDRFSGISDRWLPPEELNAFTGGTINGVTEHLDYLAELGVTALWLSPIFTAISYHGYDTVDYFAIDPRFGTKEDLQRLVQAAHRRNMYIILDFVANHTGVTFAPFIEAQKPTSAYRHWFSFDSAYKHGYRTFFDVSAMPQLNTDEPAVRRYLCAAATYWLTAFDIDGYRLDYAAGPSHAFWSEFRAACKAAKADCWLFGEATLAGTDLRTYQGRLDGALDFTFCRQIRRLCASSTPQITLSAFLTHLRHAQHFFGTDFLQPAFIDNHDMNRFLWVAGNDKQRLRLALGLLFALGGPPVLYYGTEVGLSQPRAKGPWREEARHPMLWDDALQDHTLLTYCQEWIAARRHYPALAAGTIAIQYLDEQNHTALIERRTTDDCVLLAINLSSEEQRLAVKPHADSGNVTAATITVAALSVTLVG
ncbi:MAG TPA: alpha-amylase family glycosyl hydrolase [Caldilineaceae bacterium]|nr:alpha-amylase family glycosyl hydrolase [Caldilineaceae bacterium]